MDHPDVKGEEHVLGFEVAADFSGFVEGFLVGLVDAGGVEGLGLEDSGGFGGG